MGKDTGFLEYNRVDNPWLKSDIRKTNYREFQVPLDVRERKKQAARCMNCGVPFCQSTIELNRMITGCPIHNLIPEWNDAIYRNQFHLAFERLLKVNPFPEFTGRVCPALCEKSCLNGYDGKSVTIHDNERFIIDMAYQKGWMQLHSPLVHTDKKIAVIGSGPAGLSVAYFLNQRGHAVTIYEREDKPGGLLMYGIPNMKLDKTVVRNRIQILEQEGIHFICNTEVGKDITRKELETRYDAIVLCSGSKEARDITAKNRKAKGVYFAVDFLTQNTKHILTHSDRVSAHNKHVVVVGGGDTGNDCVGTCIRHGCQSMVQLEMMPKAPEQRLPSNPWPEWPKISKTDYGQQESADTFGQDPRIYQTTIKECLSNKGILTGVITVQVTLKNGKLEEVSGSEKQWPCDLLLIAAGFTGVEATLRHDFKLDMTNRNVFDTHGFQTKSPKIFACGDARRGQSLVVWAITEGKDCAKAVDRSLMGYTSIQ